MLSSTLCKAPGSCLLPLMVALGTVTAALAQPSANPQSRCWPAAVEKALSAAGTNQAEWVKALSTVPV